jgi:hypothetical protein
MNKQAMAKLALALVLLATAGWLFVKLRPERGSADEQAYFYDLSAQKLFVAPRRSVAPIRGIDNADMDGVRAIVISTSGDPKDKASRKVAYLEKYAPELKQVLEAVQAGKAAAVPSHQVRQGLTFVKRLSDAEWHSVNTPEGEKIMTEWQVPGPDGKMPAICSP